MELDTVEKVQTARSQGFDMVGDAPEQRDDVIRCHRSRRVIEHPILVGDSEPLARQRFGDPFRNQISGI